LHRLAPPSPPSVTLHLRNSPLLLILEAVGPGHLRGPHSVRQHPAGLAERTPAGRSGEPAVGGGSTTAGASAAHAPESVPMPNADTNAKQSSSTQDFAGGEPAIACESTTTASASAAHAQELMPIYEQWTCQCKAIGTQNSAGQVRNAGVVHRAEHP